MISVEGLRVEFAAKPLFSNVSFVINDRDRIALVGKNGAGKSTMLKILCGMQKPTDGRVAVPQDTTIGYLPQYNHIDRMFPISVRDVVLTGLGAQKRLFAHFSSQHETQVDDALQRLDLMSLADRHIAALSGGQLQRVLLARAIVSKPDILILDEPNTYMDRHFQNDMYQLLHDLNNDCAIAIVSHDLDAVTKHAKRVLKVDHSVVEM